MLNAHCEKVVLGTIDIGGRTKLCCAYLNTIRKTGYWYSRQETKYVQQQWQGLN